MDRNEIARRAFKAGTQFAHKNGHDGLLVPPRLAAPGGDENRRIAACVCSTDAIPSNFAMAFAAMQYLSGRQELPFVLCNMKGGNATVSRNAAIEQAQANGCGWVLLMDPTVTFPANAMARLYNGAQEHKLDVVGATIANRAYPHANMAGGEDGLRPTTVDIFVEVAILPPALMLIRLEALKALKRPYFRSIAIEEGELLPAEYAKLGIPAGVPLTLEDHVYFCTAARRAGLKVMVDIQLSAEVVSWGEVGFHLSGNPDENQPQYDQVELGQPQRQAAPETPTEGAQAPTTPASQEGSDQ